jgi:hypothetical protein
VNRNAYSIRVRDYSSNPGLTLKSTRCYEGIVLARVMDPAAGRFANRVWDANTLYVVKVAGDVGVATASAMSRAWMTAYVNWHRSRGRAEVAASLFASWLAAQKADDAELQQ